MAGKCWALPIGRLPKLLLALAPLGALWLKALPWARSWRLSSHILLMAACRLAASSLSDPEAEFGTPCSLGTARLEGSRLSPHLLTTSSLRGEEVGLGLAILAGVPIGVLLLARFLEAGSW